MYVSSSREPCVSSSSSFLVFIFSFKLKEPINNFIGLDFKFSIKMLFDFVFDFLIRAIDSKVALFEMISTWYLRRELVESLEMSKMLYLLIVNILCKYYKKLCSIKTMLSSDHCNQTYSLKLVKCKWKKHIQIWAPIGKGNFFFSHWKIIFKEKGRFKKYLFKNI